MIRTDGWLGYKPLPRHGFVHEPNSVSASDDPAHISVPTVHRVASLLKRRLLGTHQGAVRAHHLDYHLDEFTFRFNRRLSKHCGLLFYRLIEQAVEAKPRPFDAIRYGDGTSLKRRPTRATEPAEPNLFTTLDHPEWFDTPQPDDYPF